MEQAVQGLVNIIGVVAVLATAYGKLFGYVQVEMVQAVIDAGNVPGKYRRLANFAVGILMALIVFGALAIWVDKGWQLIPVGMLAGLVSSIAAGEQHDAKPRAAVPAPAAGDGGERTED